MKKILERLTIWLAWRLPRRLVYWCAVRVNSNATVTTHTDRTPGDVSIVDALRSWT